MTDVDTRLHFRFDWKVTLLVMVLMPLTLSLGNWQLRRADEKTAMIAARDAGLAQAPVPLADLLPAQAEALRYRRVVLRGAFDRVHCFLLDNQVHQGRVGYEIICPFQDELSSQQVLVSRGFVVAPPLRSQLPDLPPTSAPLMLTAQVYVPTGDAVRLAELQTNPGWPKVVQVAAVDYLEQLLGTPVYPYVLRLEPGSPALIEAHWQVVNLGPEKHIGYAVQWFAMSVALLLIAIVANTNLMPWFKQRKQRD